MGTRREVKRATLGPAFLVRMVVLSCAAVIGSAWGLVRFYTRVKEPMTIAVARDGGDRGAWDAGAGMIEIEVAPEPLRPAQ